MLWQMKQKGFNHQAWHWIEHQHTAPSYSIMVRLRFSHPIFVSSNWTQRIRSLVKIITYFEPSYLLDYNYIVIALQPVFLWVHILMVKEEVLTIPLLITHNTIHEIWSFDLWNECKHPYHQTIPLVVIICYITFYLSTISF